ncbi:hypothetical protein GCM10022291_13260 [Postechiella marina]|uniref:Uncharacterized protein n=1 Tax=Postechiella marina TaxID=943941 RepID=A0ABP8C5T8_9FLAO
MIFSKIKGGALQFTMFVVVVIALLLSAFILLTHTYKTFKVQTDFTLETTQNADTGIQYVLNNNILKNDSVFINLTDETYKTLQIHRNFWGVLEKVTSISKIKNKRFRKVALVGGIQPEMNRTALYLEDNNRPLVLVGNTKIKGTAYLPKQGVRTGNISGHSYYGNELIYGLTKESKTLPKPNKEFLERINNIRNEVNTVNETHFLDLERSRNHLNLFYNPLRIIYSTSSINLSEVSLIGHILVQSETKIIVDESSHLKDVVLIAPKIEIKNHVKSTFQAIATESISVGDYCKLDYPSTLVLKDSRQTLKLSNNRDDVVPFKIGKYSKIKGQIVYLGGSKNYNTQVFIDEDALIMGEVYCNKNLELLGSVHGSVYTSGFVANQSGSAYQNHIYNGSIVVDNLPQEYVGLTFKGAKKGIVKWLY